MHLLVVHARLLFSAGVDDGWLELKLHLTGSAASGLELLYDLHACIICDLAEDDVLAIEPGGDDGGDEELRAVTIRVRISTRISMI
jgi:hypothetical protein